MPGWDQLPTWNDYDFSAAADYVAEYHDKMVDVYEQWQHEEQLREEFPTLQEAWEQYQAVLKLVDTK